MSMELVKADQGPEQQQVSIPDVLAVLPLPDIVVFPYMIVPLFVNRDRSAKAVDQALSENRMILMVSQKNANVDDPKAEDLHDFGTVSVIMRMLKLPDGRVRILVQGFSRAKVEYFDDSKAYITAKVEPKTEPQVVPDSPELEALIRNVKSSLEKMEQYRRKIKKAKMPSEVTEEAERQIGRLERMHPDAAETATLRNYLDWTVSLPWSKSTKDNLDLKKAQKILDEDHYGLEKIKERIVEHLAVRKLKKDTKGPILCFVGPPGVGKTSLGKSIARALGRKFVRISLGGVHDEAEIRGHRRTYVGAMPGRIIQSIHQASTNNPVFMK